MECNCRQAGTWLSPEDLDGQRAKKGIIISTYPKFLLLQDAKDYVPRIEKKIILIDGEQLAQYMIDNNVGVAEMVNYSVKQNRPQLLR